jgi:hypothetical protein
VKAPEPGARRYFFVPSTDGAQWELAEATYRRRAWDVAYPGQVHRDRFDDLPPPRADWVEMVPPGRAPKGPWPPKLDLAQPPEPASKPRTLVAPPSPPKPAKPKAPAVPRKAIPGMSKDLAALMREQQFAQEAPAGMVKCPLCGAPVEPTKTKKVRTHDDPLKGARCEASNRPVAEFAGRPPRPKRR